MEKKEMNSKLGKWNGKISELNEKLKKSEDKNINLDKRVLFFENGLKSIGENLECPITEEIMTKQVVAPSGNSYEQKALADWIERKNTDPKSVRPLSMNQVYPNLFWKKNIDKYQVIMDKKEKIWI